VPESVYDHTCVCFFGDLRPAKELEPEDSNHKTQNRRQEESHVTWELLRNPLLRLHYAVGHEADARNIAAMVEQGYPLLLRRLALQTLPATLEVFLHPEPTEIARAGTTRCTATSTQGSLALRIEHLAPSAHAPGGPYDDHYHFRVLMHELAAPMIAYRIRIKPPGWPQTDAPEWFHVGFAGYLSLVCSDEHNRTVTNEQYKDLVRADPDRVQATPDGIGIAQPLIDGTVLVMYMHEHYGPFAGLRLLHSPEPTFWGAVDAEFGLSAEQLVEQVQMWLNSPFHEH